MSLSKLYEDLFPEDTPMPEKKKRKKKKAKKKKKKASAPKSRRIIKSDLGGYAFRVFTDLFDKHIENLAGEHK